MPFCLSRTRWPGCVPGATFTLARAPSSVGTSNSPPSAAVVMAIGHARIKVGAVAVEEIVRLDRNEDVEIARRAAAQARFALIGEADAGAVLDALGDIDRELAVLLAAALATAIGAGVLEDLAAALADRAGALDGEKALRRAHLAVARAMLAGRHAGAGLGAAAIAGLAGDERRHVDLDGAAEKGFLER